MRYIYAVVLAFGVFFIACKPDRPLQNESDPLPEIITKEILSSYQNCPPDSASCTYAQINYPVFTDTSKASLNNLILDKILFLSADFMREGVQPKAITEVSDNFINDYVQFVREFENYSFGWYLKINTEIIYNAKNLVSYQVSIESFTGGAHQNSSISFFVVDARTNRELKMHDIISDTAQFKIILEEAFRKSKGIEEGQSFADAGFYINDGDFILSNNIGITEDQVIFHFNPYEIAPYALGPSTIQLDRNKVKNLLKIE
jgi:hypothetical protein